MSNPTEDAILQQIERIANALERQWPPAPKSGSLVPAQAYVWHSDQRQMAPVKKVNRLDLKLLRGVDEQRDLLMTNTTAFANGLPANNALLWGARGTGGCRRGRGPGPVAGAVGLFSVSVAGSRFSALCWLCFCGFGL